MFFQSLYIISPSYYYHFQSKASALVDIDTFFNNQEYQFINLSRQYSSNEISKLDAAYQIHLLGLNLTDYSKKLLPNDSNFYPTTKDNYVFAARYFNKLWLIWVLFLRICSLKNPILEIYGFLYAAVNVKRVCLPYHAIVNDANLDDFNYTEHVSVIIPTLNRYDYLYTVLTDFEAQSYKNFTIIIVDQSEPYLPDFYKQFNLNIKIHRQVEKKLWLARNTAIRLAKSNIVAFSEDDVRIGPDWLLAHLYCLKKYNVNISNGPFYPDGSHLSKSQSIFRFSDQFATGNACMYKSVFEEVGLFDEQFEKMRGGDGEFGLRAYLAGFIGVNNPFASCIDIKAPTGGLRQMGSWDSFRPTGWFSPRPVPSVLYFMRKYHGLKRTCYLLASHLPLSLIPYTLKKQKVLLPLFLLLIPFTLPFVTIQVIKSWRISSKMLKAGQLIPTLHADT